MITADRYLAVERNLRWVAGQLKPVLRREIADDLLSAEYVLSVVRSYARQFEDGVAPEDRTEALENLFTALFRQGET